MNLVVIKGNLGQDPTTRTVKVGNKEVPVTTFTVAVNRKYTTTNGTKGEETTWIKCSCWDSAAITVQKYFSKGDPILLEGSLKQNDWVDKNGQKRSDLEVRVSNFEILKKREQNSPTKDDNTNVPTPDPAVDDTDDDEDTPF